MTGSSTAAVAVAVAVDGPHASAITIHSEAPTQNFDVPCVELEPARIGGRSLMWSVEREQATPSSLAIVDRHTSDSAILSE